jgi:hypothetical protein
MRYLSISGNAAEAGALLVFGLSEIDYGGVVTMPWRNIPILGQG